MHNYISNDNIIKEKGRTNQVHK